MARSCCSITGDRFYEVRAEVEAEPGTDAGLILVCNERLFCGLGLDGSRLHAYRSVGKLTAGCRYDRAGTCTSG